MKSTLCLILYLTITIHCFSSPFTPDSTGRDWNAASESYKREYCNMLAAKLQSVSPGITGNSLYINLNEFYDSTDPQILNCQIVKMIGLTTAALHYTNNDRTTVQPAPTEGRTATTATTTEPVQPATTVNQPAPTPKEEPQSDIFWPIFVGGFLLLGLIGFCIAVIREQMGPPNKVR
jgi:hypothetical protein